MRDLSAFQRDLMFVIDGLDAPVGSDIRRVLTRYYHGNVSDGRLYPNLDRLARRGLIEKGARDGRTNVYTLTPEGARRLDDHREWRDERLTE